jgi:hypothetical protein
VALVAAGAAAGVAVSGQVKEVEPPKMTVANKPANPVPVTGVITGLPAVRLVAGSQIELSPDTITMLKAEQVVRIAHVEWEYRELRVNTAPASYKSVMAPLAQAGAEGWETTGITFSDAGATIIILKRQR